MDISRIEGMSIVIAEALRGLITRTLGEMHDKNAPLRLGISPRVSLSQISFSRPPSVPEMVQAWRHWVVGGKDHTKCRLFLVHRNFPTPLLTQIFAIAQIFVIAFAIVENLTSVFFLAVGTSPFSFPYSNNHRSLIDDISIQFHNVIKIV